MVKRTDIRTMEDFSAYVGLSRPTVSKFFNDPASVRDTTRARIETALKESGFSPNIFAVNLKRRRSRIIGIIIPNSTDPFYMELTRSVEELAAKAGYLAFMLSTNGQHALESSAIDRLQSMTVAGLIVVPTGATGRSVRLAQLEDEIPLVYVDSPPDHPVAFVGTDNMQSMGLIVDYLCRSGEPPCYLGMPNINRNAAARLDAYLRAMAAAGQPPHILPIPESDSWEFERFGHECARDLLAGGLPTRTLLCANDRIALGAQLAAWEAGLKVGRDEDCDLRIAGHDDHPQARFSCPPLTTVAQNYGEMAHRAMSELITCIEHDGTTKPRNILLRAELKLRASA
ncbi:MULTISPECIES: LacI family DNA-binding transcriptional regulator [Salipiger]|uniref:Transcriptional regulator n=2 Tax=Salipiger profundus TaxID=1229727 RepID=A0A1U7DDT4_9RHOB|nr:MULTISPECIES: LacI family DNA-binding transcriptional regulator [Salipiger]APX26283.1 transcriptional regulator [Salipiger profundus]